MWRLIVGAADVQLQLGGRETAALDHGAEDSQQAQVQVRDLAEQGLFHVRALILRSDGRGQAVAPDNIRVF